jgi:hypothetical protein
MGIRAVGAMRRAKLMIGGRILALAVQFTLARDAAAQLATDQPRLQMEQQCESAFALCASHMVVAETANQNGFTASLSTRCQTARVIKARDRRRNRFLMQNCPSFRASPVLGMKRRRQSGDSEGADRPRLPLPKMESPMNTHLLHDKNAVIFGAGGSIVR